MKVFISHSSSEKWAARKISEDIVALGCDTFLDERDIVTGEPIDDAIHRHLSDCDHFLLLLSPASLKSHWVLVELGGAIALKKHVVPVLLYVGPNEIPAPIKRYLARDINELDKYYRELKAKRTNPQSRPEQSAPKVAEATTFKVGDRVRVAARPMPKAGNISWNSEDGMDAFCAVDATVTLLWPEAAAGHPRGARLDVDKGKWVWAFEWLAHSTGEGAG